MDWLSQNWIWVAVGIGVTWYLLRGNLGGHGARHGGLMGMGHGGGSGGGDTDRPDSRAVANAPEAAVDPVSGEAVRTAQALTSLYLGKIYYFTSKENRDRFEATPQEHAQKTAGYPVRSAETPDNRSHRGC
jgi:YHS domain-containing protein